MRRTLRYCGKIKLQHVAVIKDQLHRMSWEHRNSDQALKYHPEELETLLTTLDRLQNLK